MMLNVYVCVCVCIRKLWFNKSLQELKQCHRVSIYKNSYINEVSDILAMILK